MRYLSAEQVLFIHARLIAETGGLHGIRDVGLLRSAVERPRATFGGKDLYRGLFPKAAALMKSLIGNHPFLDGNKPTAITAAGCSLGSTDTSSPHRSTSSRPLRWRWRSGRRTSRPPLNGSDTITRKNGCEYLLASGLE